MERENPKIPFPYDYLIETRTGHKQFSPALLFSVLNEIELFYIYNIKFVLLRIASVCVFFGCV